MKYLTISHLLLWIASASYTSGKNVEIHGSGTSNPSRCLWHVLETMEVQTKLETHLTYRSTSTGPGQKEFIGNITHPYNDFSSGDVPFSKEDYEMLKSNGVEMLHLPILMGAIGVYHSVPVERGYDLNLTSCVVAKIFKREITDWTHPDILAMNPKISIPKDAAAFPITVSRRSLSSSSTDIFTQYLHKSCPAEWDASLVGGLIEWEEDTVICEGSSAMSLCIKNQEGSIGYVDSGFGLSQGLSEVALEMLLEQRDEFYLTSRESFEKNGILSALSAEDAGIPDRADADWSTVDIINKNKEYIYTWPMVSLTYLYVRKDLSYFSDPRAQTLLIAFLKNMYNSNYVGKCESEFGFVLVKGSLQDVALSGIDSIVHSADAPEWITETDVLPTGEGQGDYVISTRRKHSFLVEQDFMLERVHGIEGGIEQSKDKLEQLQYNVSKFANTTSERLAYYGIELENLAFGQDEQQDLTVAYVLAILSLCLWFFTTLGACMVLKSQRVMIDQLTNRTSQATNGAEKH